VEEKEGSCKKTVLVLKWIRESIGFGAAIFFSHKEEGIGGREQSRRGLWE